MKRGIIRNKNRTEKSYYKRNILINRLDDKEMIKMKSIQKYLSIMLVIALVICLFPVQVEAASNVKLSKTSVTLNITQYNNKTTYGKSTITVKKSKGIKITKVSCKSANSKIAKVTSKGKVTAKKKGSTKITVTVKYKKGNKSYTKKLTYKVKVKVVNKKVKQTTQATTEKTTTTEKPTTPTTTEKQTTTEKKTEQPTTQEKTTEEVTTEEKTTEEPATKEDVELPKDGDTYVFSEDGENIIIKYRVAPAIGKAGEYDWYNLDTGEYEGTIKIPALDDAVIEDGIQYGIWYQTKPSCESLGWANYYDLRTGRHTKNGVLPALGHIPDGIYHATQNADKTGYAGIKCTRCDDYISGFKYKLTNDYRYTEWVQEPTATQEGIQNVYQGAKVEGKTEEELAELYTVYDIVYADGTPDKLYGKWIDDPNNNGGDYFEVYATTVPQLMKTDYYPKCQTITIELGNGETAEVQGYYDTEMADEVYELLNQYRTDNGLNILQKAEYLQNISDTRAAETAYTTWFNFKHSDEEDYQPHYRPNRTYFSSIYGTGYGVCGENSTSIAWVTEEEATGIIRPTTITAEAFMKGFKSSVEHNKKMLDPDFTKVGVSIFVGYDKAANGEFTGTKYVFVLQNFN